MKRILITGGSGFIGSHFAEALGGSVELINADIRLPLTGNPIYPTHLVDIRNKEALRLIFQNHRFDGIIHLAAAHKDFGVEQDEYFTTNVDGTQNLVSLAEEFNIKNIAFYSSVAVYGETDVPTDDETPPRPTNDYGRSKLAAEEVLKSWWRADEGQRKLLIIRPALVYGERNVANMYRLIDQIAKGRYFNVGDGANIKSVAYVKNLVEATWHLFCQMRPGIFIGNYSDRPHLKTAELSSTIAEALGRPKPRSIPMGMLLFMAKPFDLMIRITGKDLPISSMRVRKYGTQTFHQAGRIFEDGFRPKYSTYDGLKRMVAWYKQQQGSRVVSKIA